MKVSGKVLTHPAEAFRRQTYAGVVATCRLGVDGTFKRCTVQEAAPLAKRAKDLEPGNSYVLETSAAVRVALGGCPQGLLEQRRALAKLPPEWPAPEPRPEGP